MGNSLSYNNLDDYNDPVYKHKANGIDSRHEKNLLRKFIHNELMNRKEVINGNVVDINKLKVFCRNSKSNEQAANFKAIENDIVNLSLPYVSNTGPLFASGDEHNLQLKTKIKTAYVPFNYNGTDNITITHEQKDVQFTKQHCENYIGAICGKQVIDNKCIINTNITPNSNEKDISIDPNNSKCFKEKTENNRFEDRTYGSTQKEKILEQLSDMGYDNNKLIIIRKSDYPSNINTGGSFFANYIISGYHLVDFLKPKWSDPVYNNPAAHTQNFTSIELTANQAGEPVYNRVNNQNVVYYPNTANGDKQGYIVLNKDFSIIDHWKENGKYYINQQNPQRNIYSHTDFENSKSGGNYVIDDNSNDYDPYKLLPRTSSTSMQQIYRSTSNQEAKMHCYFNLRRMVILNYMYVNELIIKPPDTSDKVFNTGEPICNCVNSPYGPNFQKATNISCLGNLAGKNSKDLERIADSTTDPLARDARKCMGWNVKYLTDHYFNGSKFEKGNGKKGLPMKISEAKKIFDLGKSTIEDNINNDTALTDPERATLKTLVSQVFAESEPNNGVQFVNIFTKRDEAIDRNYVIRNSGSTNSPGHNYQVKLNKELYDVADSGDTTKSGFVDYFIAANDKDMVCQTSNIHNKKGNRPEQAPYYYTPNTQDGDVTCVNSISFNNISVETLNIGSILQNNTCGNVGNIQQTFITQALDTDDNRSKCAQGFFKKYLYISGFTIGTTLENNYPKLVNSLDSNLNGVYRYDEQLTNANTVKDPSGEDVSPYQIYQNMSNDDKIILVIHTSTGDVPKISAKVYINHLGNQVPIINSREFNFSAGNKNDNEELCMALDATIFGLLINDLESKNNLDGSNLYGKPEQAERFKNFYKSSSYKDSEELLSLKKTKGGAIIPDYSWVPQLDYVNATSRLDNENYQRFLNSRNGLVSTGVEETFSLNPIKSIKPFFSNAHVDQSLVQTLYLEEVSNNLDYEGLGGENKPIFGITKIFTTAESLNSAGVIYDVETPVTLLEWSNMNGDTGSTKEFIKRTHTLSSSVPDPKDIYDFNFDNVDTNKSFICYNPTLQRYVLIHKSKDSSYIIMGCSGLTNRSLSNLQKDENGKNTVIISSKLLRNLPLRIYKESNERTKFFMWQGKTMELVTDYENVDRKWTLKNFNNYTDMMENLNNKAKIPSKITFNLVNQSLKPGEYTNSENTHKNMIRLFDNPIYQPNNVKKTLMENPSGKYKNNIDEFRQLRFVMDMYGELGKNDDVVLQTEKDIPHEIKGLNYERLHLKRFTFGRKRYEDNTPSTDNIFTFENGKWILKRCRTDQEGDFPGIQGNSDDFDLENNSTDLGKRNVRLEFNILGIISQSTSIIDLDMVSNALREYNMKVTIMPTSEYYLELCFNKLGLDTGELFISDSDDNKNDGDPILAPWKEALNQSFIENKDKLNSYEDTKKEVARLMIEEMTNYFTNYKKIRLSNTIDQIKSENKHSSLLTQNILSFSSNGYDKTFVKANKNGNKYYKSLNKLSNNNETIPLIDRILIKIQTSAGIDELREVNLMEMMGYINKSLNIINIKDPKPLRQFILKVGVIDNKNYEDSQKQDIKNLNEKSYGEIRDGDDIVFKLCDNTKHFELQTDATDEDYFDRDNSIFRFNGAPRLYSNSFIMHNETNMAMNGGMKTGVVTLKTTLNNLQIVSANIKGLEDEVKSAFDSALNNTFSKFGCIVEYVPSPEGFKNTNKIQKIEGFDNFKSMFKYNLIENVDNTEENFKQFKITYLYYTYDDTETPESYFPGITLDGKKVENSGITLDGLKDFGIITPKYKKGWNDKTDFLKKGSNVAEDGYNHLSKIFHKNLFVKLNSGKDTFENGNVELTVIDKQVGNVELSIYSTEDDPYLEAVKTISLSNILKRVDNQINQLKTKVTNFKNLLLVKYDNANFNTPIIQYFENIAPGTTNEGIIKFIENDYKAKKGTGYSGLMQILQEKSSKTIWESIIDYEYSDVDTLQIQQSSYYINFIGAIDSIQTDIYARGLDTTASIILPKQHIIENGILDRRIKDYHRQINKKEIQEKYDVVLTDEQNIVANDKCAVEYNFENPNDTDTCANFEKTIATIEINKLIVNIANLGNTTAITYSSNKIGIDRNIYDSKKAEYAEKQAESVVEKDDTIVPDPTDLTDPESPGKSNTIFIVIGIVLLLAVVAFFVLNSNKGDDYVNADYGDADYGDADYDDYDDAEL